MDFQLFLSIVFVIFAALSVLITLASYIYPTFAKKRKMNSQERKIGPESQKSVSDVSSKEIDSTRYKINTDTWQSLEGIISGLRDLSLVRSDADSAFLSIVQILLTSFLQSLRVNTELKSSPEYQNISFLIMINDTDPSINYSKKDWKHELISGDDYYQSDVTVARDENAYFEYRFIGTGINCFVGILPDTDPQTLVDIILDRKYIGEKIIPSTKVPTQQSIFQRYDLMRKEHTIKIMLKQGTLALDAIGIYP